MFNIHDHNIIGLRTGSEMLISIIFYFKLNLLDVWKKHIFQYLKKILKFPSSLCLPILQIQNTSQQSSVFKSYTQISELFFY